MFFTAIKFDTCDPDLDVAVRARIHAFKRYALSKWHISTLEVYRRDVIELEFGRLA